MMDRQRHAVIVLALVLVGLGSAVAAQEVLLFDEFDKQGPLAAEPVWHHHADKAPYCEGGIVLTTPGRGFHSCKVFSKPITVEFKGVWLTQSDCPSDNNNIGITPGHSQNMICFRFAKGNLYAVRRFKGTVYGEPNKISPGEWGTPLGKIATRAEGGKASATYDLRIDWWPGKLLRFYVNGKKVAEYEDHVSAESSPIGVRDEKALFRIGSIGVTRLAEDADAILAERERIREAARRAKKAAQRVKEEAEEARIRARIQSLAEQFPRKLRMVIGGPCYFWGIDTVIRRDLTEAGMDVLVWPDAPLLAPDDVRFIGQNPMLYNIIIFSDGLLNKSQPDPNTGEIPGYIKKNVEMFRRFLDEGGSIWFGGLANQDWGRTAHTFNFILRELHLGAEVVGQGVMDTAVMKKGTRRGGVSWVDVMPDPLTRGVKNVLHPGGVVSGEGSLGVVPIVKLSPEWRLLLRGKPTAASFPIEEGNQAGALLSTPGTVKSSPMLCAVRRAGKGRVVLWPTWTNFTVTGGSGGPLVDGKKDGKYSDGARLIENLLCWLAEPSQGSRQVGIFEPKKHGIARKTVDVEADLRTWRKPGRRDFPRAQFRGLIGAHSNLSDGRSTPEEMIKAAKKAGYDFIAFTEDFSRMDEAKWKKLLGACDGANRIAPGLVAYPGLDFLDEAGNRGVVFGHRYWIKDEWRSKQDRSRIRWWYNLSYQADSNPRRWLPRVIIRSKTNNKRPVNQGLWSFFGAYCYEGGKLVDDSFHEWRRLIGPQAFFLNTGIMAIHTVRSTEEIAASARPGLYQTYVNAANLPQALERMKGCTGPWPQGSFPTYISSGPEILEFTRHVAVMGGEGSFELAHPGNDHGWLHILVQSDAGLKDVEVYDGDKLFRRFRAKGKRFEVFMTILGDACHCYSMTVTDRRGRKAVSWNAFLQIQEKIHRRCGDNWNWMTTGKGAGSPDAPRFGYCLHEVTHGWAPKVLDPKRQPGRRRYICEQGRYGHGGLSGVINGYIRGGGLLVDGTPWPSGYPASAFAMNFETVGRYGVVLTTTAQEELMVKKREPYTIGAFSGPYKVVPSPWPAELRQFFVMEKPGGGSINRCRARVRFVKQVAAPGGGKSIGLSLGATGNPTATIVEVMNPDGTSVRHDASEGTVTGEVPQGGYVCWYDAQGDGVGGVIALSPGVRYSYKKQWQACHVNVPSPVQPGTEVTWDVIYVTGSRATSNSNAPMEEVRLGLGIAGKPTLYDVRTRTGKVVDQKYFLTLQAGDGGFSGKIVKTPGKTLPIHLPVMVRGLNPRWSAAIWYRGKTQLHTPDYFRDKFGVQTWRWVAGKYDPKVDEVRPIPILDGGVGYCQVDTEKQDSDVFIGNPLVCDAPEMFLTMVKAERGKCTFEINNPTERNVTCTVRPAKGFGLTGRWRKQLMLPPGGFRRARIGL